MDQNCLTCEYEPEWEDRLDEDCKSRQRSGDCKVSFTPARLPLVYEIVKWKIVLAEDGSCAHKDCPAWAPKRTSSAKPISIINPQATGKPDFK